MAEIGHGLGLDERERWRMLRKARNRILVIVGTGTVGRQVPKTLADFEINDIAALPPLLCYNSYLCFDSSACASECWFVSCARVGASYSRISRYVNNSPS